MSQAFLIPSHGRVSIPPFRDVDAPYRGPVGGDIPPASQWYWSDDAGRFLVTNGIFKSKPTRLHHVEYSWISFVLGNGVERWNPPLHDAILKYLKGLRKYATENPGAFLVPLGEVCYGRAIRECTDSGWMTFVNDYIKGKPQHEIFAIALSKWLNNRYKYEVIPVKGPDHTTYHYLDLDDFGEDPMFGAYYPTDEYEDSEDDEDNEFGEEHQIEYGEGSEGEANDQSDDGYGAGPEESEGRSDEEAENIDTIEIPVIDVQAVKLEPVPDFQGITPDSQLQVVPRNTAFQTPQKGHALKRKRESACTAPSGEARRPPAQRAGRPSSPPGAIKVSDSEDYLGDTPHGEVPSSPVVPQPTRRTKKLRSRYIIIEDD